MSSVFYTITAEIDPAVESEWFEWYSRVHVRDVLAQPDFLRATIYKADVDSQEWSKYVVMYEVASRVALDAYLGGDEVHRLRADFQSHYGAVTRLSRQVLTPLPDLAVTPPPSPVCSDQERGEGQGEEGEA